MKMIMHGIAFDSASFIGATYGRYGGKYPMRTYDDGFGPLWVYSETLGPLGIVRAQTWEDAWAVCEDEIMDDADPETIQEFEAAAVAAHAAGGHYSDAELPEGCGYRSSGQGSHPWNQTGIYQQDLNGNSLDLLTPEVMEAWGIILQWEKS